MNPENPEELEFAIKIFLKNRQRFLLNNESGESGGTEGSGIS